MTKYSLIYGLLALSSLSLLGACSSIEEPALATVASAPGLGDTASDARARAQGQAAAAGTQLQFGFGPSASPKPQNPEAHQAVAAAGGGLPAQLAETRTYLGTIACPAGGACSPLRTTLTLAPNGQWRARMQPISGAAPELASGCWYLTGAEPVRLALLAGDNPRASLVFVQNSVLRVERITNQAPLLESRLTRQADIDPIAELNDQAGISCQPV